MKLNKKEWNGVERMWFVREAEKYPGLPTNSLLYERGWGNGYAIVPKGNPLYGVEEFYESGFDLNEDSEITYAGYMVIQGAERWVIGFDTAHHGDNILKWPKEAVERSAKKLAEEVAKIGKQHNNVK